MFKVLSFEVGVKGNLISNCSEIEAKIRVRTPQGVRYEVAEGKGPVNALDKALRKALLPVYPFLKEIKMIDYQVFISNGEEGTESVVSVVVVSSNGESRWITQRESANIIEASLWALIDSFAQGFPKQTG